MMFTLWVVFSAGLVIGVVTTTIIIGVDKTMDWAGRKK